MAQQLAGIVQVFQIMQVRQQRPGLFLAQQRHNQAAEFGIYFQALGGDIFRRNADVETALKGLAIMQGNRRAAQGSRPAIANHINLAAQGNQISIRPALLFGGEPISSTRIRSAIVDSGDVGKARAMLGRPYVLEGEIVKGAQLGRKLGFPTANFGKINQLLPTLGVYAGYVHLGNSPKITSMPEDVIPAVFNIGKRPTVRDAVEAIHIEAHLLTGAYDLDSLYGYQAAYYLTQRIRTEQTFEGIDALKDQIQKDVNAAQAILSK